MSKLLSEGASGFSVPEPKKEESNPARYSRARDVLNDRGMLFKGFKF